MCYLCFILSGLYVAAKALRQAELLKESMESTFAILQQVGEALPRAMGDDQLTADILLMNGILQKTADDSILNMEVTSNKRIVTLMKLYANLLAFLLHFADPSLIGAVSLRMVEITMNSGLTSISPLAFAHYGETLASIGYITEGCRLGRLALKLLEKICSTHRSSIICIVYQMVLWANEPLQSIVDAHRLGEKAGRQAGDFLYATVNWALSIQTSFVAGHSLDAVRDNLRDYIRKMQSENNLHAVGNAILLHSQCLVLKEGLAILDAEGIGNIPTERDLVARAVFGNNKVLVLAYNIHQLVRAFLFRQLDDKSLDINVLGTILEEKHQLRPFLLMGIFFEGLVCFQLARQTNIDESAKWMEKGEAALSKMKIWNQHSTWNFENKMLLLEAEKMHTLGTFDRAATLYESAIRSAREHKFIHEEAIASELAGFLYHERRLHQKALNFQMHSIRSYEKWGALAIAKRVETFIADRYGEDYKQLGLNEDSLSYIFASSEGASKKRQMRE